MQVIGTKSVIIVQITELLRRWLSLGRNDMRFSMEREI